MRDDPDQAMKLSDETCRASDWAELAPAAFHEPDTALDRLYEIACRDQWTVAGLDWSALDLAVFPLSFRQAAADLFAQLEYGELAAMMAASRMIDRLPSGAARLVCATQVNDEARHVRFFANLIGRLGCAGRVRPSVRQLMAEVYEADTPEATMLGMQILIEGVAHSFFLEGARLFAEFPALGPPFDAVKTVITDWLPRLLGRDESRHIAFGLHFLRARLPGLGASERAALERKVERWGEMVYEMASDPDVIDGVGVDGKRFGARCMVDLNLRLAQAGMETRIREVREVSAAPGDAGDAGDVRAGAGDARAAAEGAELPAVPVSRETR